MTVTGVLHRSLTLTRGRLRRWQNDGGKDCRGNSGGGCCCLRFAMSVAADPVQLTPSQTLALYGDTLQVEYYAGNNAQPETMVFDYAGTTLDLLSEQQFNDGIRNPFSELYNQTSGLNSLASWQTGAPALIYKYHMTFDRWESWHGDDGVQICL